MVLSIIQSRKNGENKKFLRHSKNYKNTTSSMAKCYQYYMAAKPLIAKIQPSVGKLNVSEYPFSLKANITRKF